ncbi:hypothetical protein BOTBODRAFT_630746 [Botryobasidium botryosum FD-172 SS1]|uniref:Rhodanese domain-containing protein n=1 Tax=Botryobasidium botryosum (strain FD-172 SS1) TaxID=930990 RepID=A0A067MPW7_BOTB1|nr:hypothetical protein BOTBODRAFT_630746 [Botryobasidium botryosum FD-172 SS1]
MLSFRLPAPSFRVLTSLARPPAFTPAPILTRARSTMSFSNSTPLLVTPATLKELPPSKTVPVDATWFMPNVDRVALKEYIARRIPRARYLDLDEVASPHPLGLKHMMPDAETFKAACERLGIEPNSHVVLYDSHGIFSSPRALFMFKAFGHERASVLDGGLPRWEDEGFEIESGEPQPVEKTSYPLPTLGSNWVRNYSQIVSNSLTDPTSSELVLDARSKGRFTGTDPEPRPSLSSGHIPNSRSLPFNTLLATNISKKTSAPYTTLLPREELRKAFDAAGVDGTRNVVNSCGSGMTAGVLWLALQRLGVSSAIYDESWTGYASRDESRIIKGEKY